MQTYIHHLDIYSFSLAAKKLPFKCFAREKNEFDSHIVMTVLKILLFGLKSGCYRDKIHFQAARNWNFCKFNYIELVSDCLKYTSSHGSALFVKYSRTHNVITAMHTHIPTESTSNASFSH